MDIKIKNEMYKIQKASVWKRISAGLLDFIVLMILATGVMTLISYITDYDSKYEEMNSYYLEYEEKYGIDFEISQEDYEKLTNEQKEHYQKVYQEFSKDERVIASLNVVINLMLLMTSIGILVAVIIAEFVIPIIFKNGQTIGKKCFAICLVKNNSVKINNISLFVRTILGKYTVEIMIPIYVLIVLMFGNANFMFVLLAGGILIFDLILFIATKENLLIHDIFSYTVVVDKSVQMIFQSEEELIEFKKELHSKEVFNKKY